MFIRSLVIPFLLLYSAMSLAEVKNPGAEIAKVSQNWAIAINSHDPEKITSLYDDNAYVYPLFKNQLKSHPELLVYFKDLMKYQDLNVMFKDQNIRLFGNTAINSGIFTFSYKENGKTVALPIRYTFVYNTEANGWKIVENHLSTLPENKVKN